MHFQNYLYTPNNAPKDLLQFNDQPIMPLRSVSPQYQYTQNHEGVNGPYNNYGPNNNGIQNGGNTNYNPTIYDPNTHISQATGNIPVFTPNPQQSQKYHQQDIQPRYTYNPPQGSPVNTTPQSINNANCPYFPPGGNAYPQYPTLQPPNNIGINVPRPQISPQKPKVSSDMMPHPLLVYRQDFDTYNETTIDTSNLTKIPPLVTSSNVSYTGYKNCSPNVLRSTLYTVPTSGDISEKCGIPLAFLFQPLCDTDYIKYSIPVVDHGPSGPIRCSRCRAYINPFVQFLNGGKNFKCNICEHSNDVSEEYFCTIDQSGCRLDWAQRPELVYGSYEMTTNSLYCRENKPIEAPIIIFMIDVSYASISTGAVHRVTSSLADIISKGMLSSYLNDSKNSSDISNKSCKNFKIGFVTYDSNIHIYCPKKSPASNVMEAIYDINNSFTSSLEAFVVDPYIYKESIIDLLNNIPKIFENNKHVEIILGPVIQMGLDAIKQLNTCGKLIIFHSGLPTLEAPGKLLLRDDRNVMGTEGEYRILSPQGTYYNELASKCIELGVGVDIFLFSSGYCDVSTIGNLCHQTGGTLRRYSYYKTAIHGVQVSADITSSLSENLVFDGLMKIRCSNGLSIDQHFGQFYSLNESELQIATMNSRKTIMVKLKYEEKLPKNNLIYVQCAFLYTTLYGRRMIRIHNHSFPVSDAYPDIYRSAEQDVLANYIFKNACKHLLTTSSQSEVKQIIINQLVSILLCYRQNCAQASSSGQLIMPEYIKLIPLYANCIINSTAISATSEITVDEKSTALLNVAGCNLHQSNIWLYPRLFDVISMIEDLSVRTINENIEGYSWEYLLPKGLLQIRSSYDRLDSRRIFLLENGVEIYIWIGKEVAVDHLNSLFGTSSIEQYLSSCIDHLPAIESELSHKTSSLISQIRKLRRSLLKIMICKQDDKSEIWFRRYLAEDKSMQNRSMNYVEFLCHLHQEIRKKISD